FPRELVREPPLEGDAHEEEERRLFYVGMTRAREELHLSWAVDYGGKRRWKMSRFVSEALAIPARPASLSALDPREAIERHAPAPIAPASAREGASTHLPLQVEQSFKFRQGLNLVSGRWDRIDERDGRITIVDFKTSDVDEEENATDRAARSLRDGQLGLYALAYRETRGVM